MREGASNGAALRVPENLVFYHTIEIAPEVRTPGWPVIVPIVDMVRDAMRGCDWRDKKVLDIGCRDGALSIEAERLGAREVVGVDFDLPRANIEYLRSVMNFKARFEQRNLYSLRPEDYGLFDVIIFSGVLYHLRYPMYGLRLVKDLLVDQGLLIVETATFADANRLPMIFCPVGSDSPYEKTSCTFFNIRGFTDTARSLGLPVTGHRSLMNLAAVKPADDAKPAIDRSVFICRKGPVGATDDALGYWDGDGVGVKAPSWVRSHDAGVR